MFLPFGFSEWPQAAPQLLTQFAASEMAGEEGLIPSHQAFAPVYVPEPPHLASASQETQRLLAA